MYYQVFRKKNVSSSTHAILETISLRLCNKKSSEILVTVYKRIKSLFSSYTWSAECIFHRSTTEIKSIEICPSIEHIQFFLLLLFLYYRWVFYSFVWLSLYSSSSFVIFILFAFILFTLSHLYRDLFDNSHCSKNVKYPVTKEKHPKLSDRIIKNIKF